MALSTKRLIERLFDFLYMADVDIRLANIKKDQLAYCNSCNRPILLRISPWPSSEPTEDGIPDSPAASLIHEALHGMFPQWKHSTIYSKTRSIWFALTLVQKLALYEILFEPKNDP